MIGFWLSLVENQSGREPQNSEKIDYLFVDMAHGQCKSYIHGTVCNLPILSLVRQLPSLFDIIYLIASSFAFKREASALHRPFCLSGFNCYISGNFFPTARALIGYFKVTWHLTIKLFPAKISQQIYDVREWQCTVTRFCYPRVLTDVRLYSKV